MKSKRVYLSLFLSAPLLAVGAYLLYQKWCEEPDVNPWDLVPDTAVMVYESKNTVSSWNTLLETTLWENLSTIPSFAKAKKSFELLDSISGKKGSIDKLLTGKSFLTSIHLVSKNEFDFLYYVNVDDAARQSIAFDMLKSFQKGGAVRSMERKYLGMSIHELSDKNKDYTFSYIIKDNHLIGSFTPFLVEDVIRLAEGEVNRGFKAKHAPLFKVEQLKNDEGDLYVDFKNLNTYFEAYVDPTHRASIKGVKSFASSSFLDISLNNNLLLMNGFSITGEEDLPYFVKSFEGQKPGKIGVKYYMPRATAFMYHTTFSDPISWHGQVQRYWSNYDKKQLQAFRQLKTKNSFDADKFLNWINGEIALVVSESSKLDKSNRFILFKAGDVNEALNQFNTLAEKALGNSGDTLYYETFAGVNIKELNIKEFPSKVLGPMYQGFEQCFYSVIDEYVILGSSIEAIKALVNDMEAENTWGKSVQQNQFLESTLQEANISLMFNVNRVWGSLNTHFNPSWRKFFDNYAGQFKHFELGSVQFSNIDGNYYTSLALKHDDKVQEVATFKQTSEEQATYLEAASITKPFVVRNHIDNSLEVVVQDSITNLYLIGRGGRVLWKDSIGESLVGQVHQVDYFKNGKLQYFFATKHAMHIIDRKGRYVEGYPIAMDKVDIAHAAVIDYDNSKRYRFLLADRYGALYMFDKTGKNLKGWQPLQLKGRLGAEPFHIRVRGKDCIVALEESGRVNIMNRRGEVLKGFPMKLAGKTSSGLYVDIGSDFKNTIFHTVSDEGLLMKFNLHGEVAEKVQLYKPDRETNFSLVRESLGKTFVIIRQSPDRLSVLNAKEEVLLEKDYLSGDIRDVQYYNFGSGGDIFAVTDKIQEFTYLYDNQGKLVNVRPFNSGFLIGLIYSERTKKFKMYHVYDRSVAIQSF